MHGAADALAAAATGWCIGCWLQRQMEGIGMALEGSDGEAFPERKVAHIIGHENGGVGWLVWSHKQLT